MKFCYNTNNINKPEYVIKKKQNILKKIIFKHDYIHLRLLFVYIKKN